MKKFLEKFALWITDKVSTITFFILILIWTLGWLLWNVFAPESWKFDPYPAFVLWLFISNMIQLFLLPLIMVGQNVHTQMMDKIAEQHFEINEEMERQILTLEEKILEKLGKIEEKINNSNLKQ